MSVCDNQHMDNHIGCEQAIEGLLRRLSKTEQLFPPARLLEEHPTASWQSWSQRAGPEERTQRHSPGDVSSS